ncbi:hypothetical protein [Aquimarina latercula]|uniref:hypothetical protein n=1 Tax=Aquimarina latercula TaxID=987 RepID=UPI000421B26C|nr:hypothetical protein [Aquimarina latercula]
MKTIKLIPLLFLAFFMINCANDSEDDLIDVIDNPDPIGDGSVITYTANIEPIIQSSCVGCHADPPVNGAPFPLINFTQVSQRAGGILNRMSRQNGAAGAMPPSGRLPQSTIDLVDQWIADGALESE